MRSADSVLRDCSSTHTLHQQLVLVPKGLHPLAAKRELHLSHSESGCGRSTVGLLLVGGAGAGW
jgi:hypothetical protein